MLFLDIMQLLLYLYVSVLCMILIIGFCILLRVILTADGLIRAETCREYRSYEYLIKTLSIVAKQKVLLFTVCMIC
jgi:hypothetical protein